MARLIVSDHERAFAGRRDAPRFSLMLRAAKLLSPNGEYACVVRDVSRTGVKLRLFHAAPPDEFCLLELANGERFPMQRMWSADVNAGFRFAQPIDVEAFIAEPDHFERRPIRLAIESPAVLTSERRELAAVLVNLSQQGACVELGQQLAPGQQVRLDLPGVPLRIGHVRWRKGFAHGLVFQNGWRLDELAAHALTLQPFGVREDSGKVNGGRDLRRYA